MNSRLAGALLALALSGVLACSPDPKSVDKDASAAVRLEDVPVCPNKATPTPADLIAAGRPREARVYLDGSVSMKGFSGQSDRFRATLDALRPALLDLDIHRSRFTRVGEDIEPLSRSGGFERFDLPSFYSRSETNLAAALNAELKQSDASTLTLIITDGVTSLRQDRGNEGDLAECEQGSDVQCLTFKLKQLINQGRGLWIIGLRSAFRGPLFSETARVGGTRLGGDVRIPDRPFYIWILSADPPTGRALAEGLLDRLAAQADQRTAFVLEVSPGDIPWSVHSSDHSPTSDNDFIPKGARAGAVRGRFTPGEPGKPPLQVVVNRNLDGSAFALSIPLHATPLREMSSGITPLWIYAPSHCLRWEGAPARGLKIKAAPGETNLRVLLLSPAFDTLSGRGVTLVQTLQRTHSEPLPWIKNWSTQDDSQIAAGSRTLNLEELVRTLQSRMDPQERFEQPLLRLNFE